MPTYTHSPVKRFLAVCENRTCGWSETHLHEDECDEAIRDHRDAHELRHTCSYDEDAGWVGVADCPACDFDMPLSLRRAPSEHTNDRRAS